MYGLRLFYFLFITLSAGSNFANSVSENLEKAFNHQKLSRELVAVKQWEKARDEAKFATVAAPDATLNRDAWLLLGATEERLGNLQSASNAYSKYLTLSPPPEKREIVALRFNETEAKANQYARYKWGTNSGGLVLGFSPQFQSRVQEQLNSDLKTTVDIGLRFGTFSFGYKKGRASLGKFLAPTTSAANSPYVEVPAGGVHLMESVYFQNNFEFGENTDTKPIVWSLPLYFAGIVNAVRSPSNDLYNNIALGIGTGLRIDFYTKSALSFDISALYHLGIPFWGISKQTETVSPSIKNISGEKIAGSNTGAEIRVGMKILFGKTPPNED